MKLLILGRYSGRFTTDVIDLYKAITGTDFTAAAETLAEKLNVDRARRSTAQARQTVPQTREKTKEVSQHRSNEKTAEIKSQAVTDYSAHYNHCAGRLSGDAARPFFRNELLVVCNELLVAAYFLRPAKLLILGRYSGRFTTQKSVR